MKKITSALCILVLFAITVSCSCSDEPIGKRIAKQTAKVGLDALEGVAEALEESGAKVGEKTMDALGTVAEGVGKSIDRQLNEHVSKIASVTGRSLVQGLEGLEGGFNEAYYDEYITKEDLDDNVALIFIGKIKSKQVIDARFVTMKKGEYSFKFEFYGSKKLLLTKETTTKIDEEKKQSIVSFYLTEDELEANEATDYLKVIAKKI